MVKLLQVSPLTTDYLESLGFVWHTDSDETPYVSDKLVVLSPKEEPLS